jgi:hypothetical protein
MTDRHEFNETLRQTQQWEWGTRSIPGLPDDPADVTALLWRLQAETETRAGAVGITESKRTAHTFANGETDN